MKPTSHCLFQRLWDVHYLKGFDPQPNGWEFLACTLMALAQNVFRPYRPRDFIFYQKSFGGTPMRLDEEKPRNAWQSLKDPQYPSPGKRKTSLSRLPGMVRTRSWTFSQPKSKTSPIKVTSKNDISSYKNKKHQKPKPRPNNPNNPSFYGFLFFSILQNKKIFLKKQTNKKTI